MVEQTNGSGKTSISLMDALNKLCRWRALLAGWQLGTRPIGDPESDAIRDHREVTLLLRTEVTTLTALLLKHGVFTQDEWVEQLTTEAQILDAQYEQRFPGVKTTMQGLEFTQDAAETMKDWRK